ncbi:MAG: hypothetical protein LBS35_00090 [Synergistaceae bacterium]|nr:hypothetical protein [Synergistaceae bacterium]
MSKKSTSDATETTETDAPENQNEGNVLSASVQGEQAEQMPPAVRAEPVIYCGPNIPKGNLMSMAIFRGGLPGHIERLTEKIPEIIGLTVPVSRLADVKKKIAVQGSEENRLNQVILSAREEI